MAALSQIIAPSFYGVHNKIRRGDFSSFWLKGGRGSTKSSFVAIQIISGIIADKDANGLALRKIDKTIRDSIISTLQWAIEMLEVEKFFRVTYSPAEITYLPTGQKIIMKGLDEPRKLKSIRLKKGYFKYLWFEEAEEFGGIKEIRSVRQSVLRGADNFVEFITYNPPNDPDAWVNKESEIDIDDRYVHYSNYLDVPKEWLGRKFLFDAELLKKVDPLAYDHEYMGVAVGRAEQIVFHGKWKEKDFITPPVSEMYQSRFFFGADWGFANDPNALIRCFILVEGSERNLYIDYETGGVGIEIRELTQLFDGIPEVRSWKIYGDCSRPETISHLRGEGFNIESAPKWGSGAGKVGSVKEGIEYLRSFHNIYIHPRCKNTMEEFKKYSYKVDRNTQDILSVLVDKNNHYIDALRYALADYIKEKVSILDVI